MSDQYAVSIRHSYTMPDETFYGYELVLWHLGRDREHLAVSCDTRIPSIQDRLTETSVGTGALRR